MVVTSGPITSEPALQTITGAPPVWYLPSLQEEWDPVIQTGIGAGLLQSWRWGEFKGATGWSSLRLLLCAPPEAGSRPLLAAQLLFRTLPKLPFPVSVAYIPRGPVLFSSKPLDERIELFFWKRIHAEARKRGAIFLKVEPPLPLSSQTTQQEIDNNMTQLDFVKSARLQPAHTIILDITQSEEALLRAMKPKTRYNIRLAGRRGVQVRPATSLDDLRAFYTLLKITGERDSFGLHIWDYYRRIWDLFGPGGDNTALVLLADHPDEQERQSGPIAGLVAFRFGREAIYMYGASDNCGREHMPNYLLQWEAIRWAKEHGCLEYDFWGIPDAPAENDEAGGGDASPINARSGLRGVYWFKKGFSGVEREYPGAYDYVYNPLLYKLWMRWRGANLG